MVSIDLARASYKTFACDDIIASVSKALFRYKFSSFRTDKPGFHVFNEGKKEYFLMSI